MLAFWLAMASILMSAVSLVLCARALMLLGKPSKLIEQSRRLEISRGLNKDLEDRLFANAQR